MAGPKRGITIKGTGARGEQKGPMKRPKTVREHMRASRDGAFDPYMDPGMFGIEGEEQAKPKKSNTGMIIAVGAAAALLLFMKK